MTTLFLIVGLPGAGKTTRAKELAAADRALRLTPDEWMIPLFGELEADGKRDVLEGRLVCTALQALPLGTSVVLDFGFWGRDERSALRRMARSAVDMWREQFQVPDAAELAGGVIPGPPAGWPDWPQWAADRWPSLADG